MILRDLTWENTTAKIKKSLRNTGVSLKKGIPTITGITLEIEKINKNKITPTKLGVNIRTDTMLDQTIASEKILINPEDEFDQISRDESDEINHYTIVPNALIREKGLSPQCRWLIIYLMSKEKEGKTQTTQLWEHTKGFIGRDGIRKLINEAIEAGYIFRNEILIDVNKGAQ